MITQDDIDNASVDADLKPLLSDLLDQIAALQSAGSDTAMLDAWHAQQDFTIAMLQADRSYAPVQKAAFYQALTAAVAAHVAANPPA